VIEYKIIQMSLIHPEPKKHHE